MTRLRTCPLTAAEAICGLHVVHARGQWWGTIIRVEWPAVWVQYAMDADQVPIGDPVCVPGEHLRRLMWEQAP